jgi:hypothetical protein
MKVNTKVLSKYDIIVYFVDHSYQYLRNIRDKCLGRLMTRSCRVIHLLYPSQLPNSWEAEVC